MKQTRLNEVFNNLPVSAVSLHESYKQGQSVQRSRGERENSQIVMLSIRVCNKETAMESCDLKDRLDFT